MDRNERSRSFGMSVHIRRNTQRDWAGADPEAVATLFVDGHVQVYSGQGRLPKHFVPRQKLCLPAAASYWVGALGGAPLLCVHKQVDPALVAELRDGLLPQLEELGLLPAAQEPSRPRLTLVFDREGWSPALFAQLAERGIAVITWRKGPQAERWPDSEFVPARLAVHAPGGEQALEGRIAERKAALGNACAAREIRFWIDRRLRRPGKSGQPRKPLELAGQPAAGERQPAILTTHPTLPAERVAGLLRSRWTQENFFKYMRAEFGLDTLAEHALVGVDADERVVNPLWRWLERALRRLRGKAAHLHRKLAAERGARSQKALQLQAETAAIERRITGLELAKRRPGACPGRRPVARRAAAGPACPAAEPARHPAHDRLPRRDRHGRRGRAGTEQARECAPPAQGAVPQRRHPSSRLCGRDSHRPAAAPSQPRAGRRPGCTAQGTERNRDAVSRNSPAPGLRNPPRQPPHLCPNPPRTGISSHNHANVKQPM